MIFRLLPAVQKYITLFLMSECGYATVRSPAIALYVITVWITLWAGPAFAAGFDCTKAHTTLERLICADKTLSNLDGQLSRLYNSVVSHSVNPEGIKRQQREWIRKVRDKCRSASCLKDAYQKRINELNDQAIELGRKGSGNDNLKVTHCDHAKMTHPCFG